VSWEATTVATEPSHEPSTAISGALPMRKGRTNWGVLRTNVSLAGAFRRKPVAEAPAAAPAEWHETAVTSLRAAMPAVIQQVEKAAAKEGSAPLKIRHALKRPYLLKAMVDVVMVLNSTARAASLAKEERAEPGTLSDTKHNSSVESSEVLREAPVFIQHAITGEAVEDKQNALGQAAFQALDTVLADPEFQGTDLHRAVEYMKKKNRCAIPVQCVQTAVRRQERKEARPKKTPGLNGFAVSARTWAQFQPTKPEGPDIHKSSCRRSKQEASMPPLLPRLHLHLHRVDSTIAPRNPVDVLPPRPTRRVPVLLSARDAAGRERTWEIRQW